MYRFHFSIFVIRFFLFFFFFFVFCFFVFRYWRRGQTSSSKCKIASLTVELKQIFRSECQNDISEYKQINSPLPFSRIFVLKNLPYRHTPLNQHLTNVDSIVDIQSGLLQWQFKLLKAQLVLTGH